MRVLLDTHAFIWWVTDDHRLSPRARQVFGDGDNHLSFSVASAWEIAIKAGLGRLKLRDGAETFVNRHVERNGISILPVRLSHALRLESLPYHHADPFDRLLVAQAQQEGLSLLTNDRRIAAYDVAVVW